MKWFRADSRHDHESLRLQLVPSGRRPGAVVITRYETFELALMRATADGPVVVGADELATMRLNARTAYKVAAAATWKYELVRLDVRIYVLSTGTVLHIAAIDDCPFVTVALLTPSPWAGGSPTAGRFVCAPRLSSVLVMNPRMKQDFEFGRELKDLARSVAAGADDPCDSEVYWWDNRGFHRPKYAAPVGGGRPVPVSPSSLQQAWDSVS